MNSSDDNNSIKNLSDSKYYIEFLIILPFWLEFPKREKFYKNYGGKHFEITILQEIWKIKYISKLDEGFFLLNESEVIDPDYMRPKLDYSGYIQTDIFQKELKGDIQYYPEKMKSVLSISLNKILFDNKSEVNNFLRDTNIWEIIKNLIRFFLSNYIYFKTQSNHRFHGVRMLSESYYNINNTFIYLSTVENQILSLFHVGLLRLNLKQEYNLPNFLASRDTIKYFRKKIFCSNRFKQKLRERLRTSINYAIIHRDMNSLIINTLIYLEQISIKYLNFKRGMKTWELNILFKEKGLRYFVENQLPHFIDDKSYMNNINDAIQVLIKRNQIVHDGRVIQYTDNLEEKCKKIIELITYLEEIIYSVQHQQEEYKFEMNLIGTVSEVNPNYDDIINVVIPTSNTEQAYIKENLFNFQNNFHLLDYDEIAINNSSSRFLKVYQKDLNLYICMILHPTRFEDNRFRLKRTVQIDIIKTKSWNIIHFNFLYHNIPKGFLEKIKRFIRVRIQSMDLKNYKINFNRVEKV